MEQAGVPAQIGPYPVVSLLARGGMGALYLGRHPALDYDVAIKILLAGRAATDDQRLRFRREVAALAKLEHPNLVKVLGAGEEHGVPWFAMRRVEGTSLEDRLHRGGPLPPEEVVELGKQLCSALSAAHAVGILHRDLKPDNVICTPTGQFVVTDFGLAKDLEVEESVRLSRTGMLQGTPRYGSPEQAAGAGGGATRATDVYGLGATLYAALTGVPPVDGQTWIEVVVATQERVPTPPSTLRTGVPGWLERVVMRCLEKSPADRYESMSALRAELERAATPASTTQVRSRRLALPGALAGIALAIVGVAFVQARNAQQTRLQLAALKAKEAERKAKREEAKREEAKREEAKREEAKREARAYTNRGLAKLNAGDHAGAIEDYTKAIELDPSSALAYTTRGPRHSGSPCSSVGRYAQVPRRRVTLCATGRRFRVIGRAT